MTNIKGARALAVPLYQRFFPHCGIAIRRHLVLRLAFQGKRFGNQTQRFAGDVNHQQVFSALNDLPVGWGSRRPLVANLIFLLHGCVLHVVCECCLRQEMRKLPAHEAWPAQTAKEN